MVRRGTVFLASPGAVSAAAAQSRPCRLCAPTGTLRAIV